jgi:hypothetical protein
LIVVRHVWDCEGIVRPDSRDFNHFFARALYVARRPLATPAVPRSPREENVMQIRFLSKRNPSAVRKNDSRATRARRGAALAAVVIAALPSAIYADDWKNNASGNWHDPNSWVDGTVPTATDFAFFTNLVTGTVSFGADAVSNGVTLKNVNGVITFDIGAGKKWTQGIFTSPGRGQLFPVASDGAQQRGDRYQPGADRQQPLR